MKKIVALGLLILSVVANASWWGDLDGGVRAAIVGGSALLLNSSYQDSELKHQRDLDKLDTQIRRDYERQAVAQNAHYKYGNSGVPARLQTATANNYSGRNSNYNNGNYSNQRSGKVVYSDGRTQIIELSDGTRITLNQ
jgi:hypothetical protein